MPTDGLTRYDKLSGKELVVELETMDRSRFPRNYRTLLGEIEARGPVVVAQLHEHEVERYDALSRPERRQFLNACVKRIGILLLQYQVLGGIVASILGQVVGEIVFRISGTRYPSIGSNATLTILLFLSVASYWAFLRWMFKERVADMEVAILRRKAAAATAPFARET
jgi:hypothetical protein